LKKTHDCIKLSLKGCAAGDRNSHVRKSQEKFKPPFLSSETCSVFPLNFHGAVPIAFFAIIAPKLNHLDRKICIVAKQNEKMKLQFCVIKESDRVAAEDVS